MTDNPLLDSIRSKFASIEMSYHSYATNRERQDALLSVMTQEEKEYIVDVKRAPSYLKKIVANSLVETILLGMTSHES